MNYWMHPSFAVLKILSGQFNATQLLYPPASGTTAQAASLTANDEYYTGF